MSPQVVVTGSADHSVLQWRVSAPSGIGMLHRAPPRAHRSRRPKATPRAPDAAPTNADTAEVAKAALWLAMGSALVGAAAAAVAAAAAAKSEAEMAATAVRARELWDAQAFDLTLLEKYQ